MPLYVQNGKLLEKDGALGTSSGCCCGGGGTCCCVGTSPLDLNEDYRRIVSITPPDTCDGTQVSQGTDEIPCAGKSLVIQWCGRTLEVAYPDTSGIEVSDPAFDAGACGTVHYMSLSVDHLPPGVWTVPDMRWASECGRCVVRLLVVLQQNTFECGTRTSTYMIDWRDGCDSSVHVELVYEDGLFLCAGTSPTVVIASP